MDLSVVPYNHSSTKPDINDSEYGDVVEPKPLDINNNTNDNNNFDDPSPLSAFLIKYGECMRNHAASIGGHANDGCGEFLPRANDGSRDSLTCAACGCHRNFHRRELPGSDQHYSVHCPPPTPPMLLYNEGPTTPRWDPKMVIGSQRHHRHHQHQYLHHRIRGRLIDHHDHRHHHHHDDVEESEYDRRSETPEREEVQVQQVGPPGRATSYKRSRTKFTQEQKDRMLAFAEKIGWRIQRHDDVALNQFCSEVGVKRNVLKVWMHNNKNAHRRRQSVPSPPPPPPPLLPEAPPPQPPPPVPPQPVGV